MNSTGMDDIMRIAVAAVREHDARAAAMNGRDAKEAAPKTLSSKKSMETSKMLMWIFTAVFLATLILAFITLFTVGEIPSELLGFVWIAYSLGFGGYCAKTAYENKPKIEKGWGER